MRLHYPTFELYVLKSFIDTGSSDLWVISDKCKGNCATDLSLYPTADFKPTNLHAELRYGDSFTGTHAIGPIGQDIVSIAGLSLPDQYFSAINDTDTNVLSTGAAGIFGLGFPINSAIWATVFSEVVGTSDKRSLWKRGSRGTFPNVHALYDAVRGSGHSQYRRQADDAEGTSAILKLYASLGPFLSRLVGIEELELPSFTITLQRNYIDIGGNAGVLTVGGLPERVKNNSLTWVPLRAYSEQEGGLAAPVESPSEVYPMVWEVFVDAVYLDDHLLSESKLGPSTISPSALLDTGNSLIRGPEDVINEMHSLLGITSDGSGSAFGCSTPHNLTFVIGGTVFPVDPRDFISQAYYDSVEYCVPNIAKTDAPVIGEGYLYSWNLGDPFLKR